MSEVSNVKIQKLYELNGLHKVVVQKGNVGSKYVYALQLLNKEKDAVVYRTTAGKDFNTVSNRLYLHGPSNTKNDNGNTVYQTAGGHTQTWEYAGGVGQNNINSEWFIGTKPKLDSNKKYFWDTQIARVKFENKDINSNIEMSRISNLNQAGRSKGLGYSGNDLVRSEAAVSPSFKKDRTLSYKYFLIVTVDKYGAGYFSLYNLSDINTELNKMEPTTLI